MRYTSLSSFEKHLKEAAPNLFSPLYLIITKDAFVRKEAIRLLASSLLTDQKNPAHALQTFDVEQQEMDAILTEIHSPNLFVSRNVFHIQMGEKHSKTSLEKLDPLLAHPPKNTFLLLSTSALSAQLSFYKKAEKAGVILDIAEEKAWEKEKSIQGWITAYVSAAGKKIEPQATQLLAKQVGTDQATLQQELEKLLCYIGEAASITARDVSALCLAIAHDTIWQLGEALFRRDVATALKISKAMLADGTPLLSLLRQIRTQFQTEFQIACILANGGSPADVTQQFPYMKGMILERHLQAAQGYGKQKFKEGILLIDEAELQAKNSQIDPDHLNDVLIVKLAT